MIVLEYHSSIHFRQSKKRKRLGDCISIEGRFSQNEQLICEYLGSEIDSNSGVSA